MKKFAFILLLFYSSSVWAFKQIEIGTIKKNPSYAEVTVIMRFQLPASLLSGGVAIGNASMVVSTYGDFTVDSIAGAPFVVITHTEVFNFTPTTLANFKTGIIARWTALNSQINGIVLKPYDALMGASWDGSNWTTQ